MSSKIILQPTNDNILVEPLSAEAKTPSGIIIPDRAQDAPIYGVIVAVGPGARNSNGVREPMDLAIGTKVMFAEYAGTPIKVNDQVLKMMKECDILAIVTP